jgi:hypothetical protein
VVVHAATAKPKPLLPNPGHQPAPDGKAKKSGRCQKETIGCTAFPKQFGYSKPTINMATIIGGQLV